MLSLIFNIKQFHNPPNPEVASLMHKLASGTSDDVTLWLSLDPRRGPSRSGRPAAVRHPLAAQWSAGGAVEMCGFSPCHQVTSHLEFIWCVCLSDIRPLECNAISDCDVNV